MVDINENLRLTNERRKEIFGIFKTIVLYTDTVSGIMTEVKEYQDLNENEKSCLINFFALAGRASVIKMSDMDSSNQDGLIEYLKETIRLQK